MVPAAPQRRRAPIMSPVVFLAAMLFYSATTSSPVVSPYHLSIKASGELLRVFNGSGLSRVSVALLHVTCTEEVPTSEESAVWDVRTWMDDAFGCAAPPPSGVNGEERGTHAHHSPCWYALVHVPVLRTVDIAVVMGTLGVSCDGAARRREWYFMLSPPSVIDPSGADGRAEEEPSAKTSAAKMKTSLTTTNKRSRRTTRAALSGDDGWWPTWADTQQPRGPASRVGGWQMPTVLRDIVNAVSVVGNERLFHNSTFHRLLAWKVKRGLTLKSTLVARHAEDEPSRGRLFIGRMSQSKGLPTSPIVSARARRIEALDIQPIRPPPGDKSISSFVEHPEGSLLVEARHVALVLFCRASLGILSSESKLSELSSSAKHCWGTIHRSQRRHAVLHVLEHEFTRRVPNSMAVLLPSHSRRTEASTLIENGTTVRVNLAAEPAPVFVRVDSLEALRRLTVHTAVLLPSEWGGVLPLHVDDVPPLEPQRIVLVRWNASSLTPPPHCNPHSVAEGVCGSDGGGFRPDRWVLKLQALLTAPEFYGRVRAFYTIVHPDIGLAAAARTLDHFVFGHHQANELTPSFAHMATLASVGSQLPLSTRNLFVDGVPGSGSYRVRPIQLLREVAAEMLDAAQPPAHNTDPNSVVRRASVVHKEAQRRALAAYVAAPLRQLSSASLWASHIVGQRRGIIAVALVPTRNTTKPSSLRLQSMKPLRSVARHFLPLRSATQSVVSYYMEVPVLDDHARVVAHPVTSTTSASTFEDHVGQVLMKTARVRRLPALIILFGEEGDGEQSSRHLLALGEFLGGGAAKKKNKNAGDQKHRRASSTRTAPSDIMTLLWTKSKLIAAIRNTSRAVADRGSPSSLGNALPQQGMRYVGKLTEAKLRAVGSEAFESARVDEADAPFINPEGWGAPDHIVAGLCNDDAPGTGEACGPWKIPARLRPKRSIDSTGEHSTATSKQVAAKESSVLVAAADGTQPPHSSPRADTAMDVLLRDVLMEPQQTWDETTDESIETSGVNHKVPRIGWAALRSAADGFQPRDGVVPIFDM